MIFPVREDKILFPHAFMRQGVSPLPERAADKERNAAEKCRLEIGII